MNNCRIQLGLNPEGIGWIVTIDAMKGNEWYEVSKLLQEGEELERIKKLIKFINDKI